MTEPRLINGLYRLVDELPAGAEIDDDPEAFAAELVAEYAAALERVRDRAMEARYGGRILRALSTDPKYAEHTPTQLDAYARDLATEAPTLAGFSRARSIAYLAIV